MVESRFDGKSLYLYVVCPDEVLADRRAMFAWAVRAAQAYCDRWQIETSFLTVKQELALGKARTRTDEATLAVDFSDISKEFGGGTVMPTSCTRR